MTGEASTSMAPVSPCSLGVSRDLQTHTAQALCAGRSQGLKVYHSKGEKENNTVQEPRPPG